MQTLFGYLPVMEFCNKSSKRRCTRRDVQRALVHSRVSYRQPSRPHTCQHRLAGAHDHLLHMQQLLPHRPAAPRLPQCRDNSPELQHVHLGLKGAGGRRLHLSVTHVSRSGTEAAHCLQAPPPLATHYVPTNWALVERTESSYRHGGGIRLERDEEAETKSRKNMMGDGCD
jgi:hypothetical protein